MIRYLQGILVHKSPTKLVIEVNGIGFEINSTLPCYENVGEIGDRTKVITYLHVREDVLQLYGFKSISERELFLHLISSPGIGPKKAQAILSSVSVEDLQKYVVEENLIALTSLPGIGKKTAQRLILDLKDKVNISAAEEERLLTRREELSDLDHLIEEAAAALTSLGFNKNSAHIAVHKVIQQSSSNIRLEDLIKKAIRLM